MASSVRKAQSPLACQLCDNPNVIKWKCTDCNLLMCENCKEKVHPRFKASEKHKIISIKDVGKEKSDDVADLFESLQISEPAVISSVVSSYTTDLVGVHKLLFSSEDILYYMNSIAANDCTFIKAKLLRQSIKILQKLDINCMDFVLRDNEDILKAPFTSPANLHKVSSNGDITTVLNTSPMLILGIHLTKRGELMLGLREQGPRFPVTEFCSRQLAVFGTNYKRKATFEFNKTGDQIFSYVFRVTTDSKDNIYVVDRVNDEWTGRIVALESTGTVRYVYSGHAKLNTPDNPFTPFDFVVTENDNIVITDKYSYALHALNNRGEIIGLQNIKQLGMLWPASLCLDSEGFLVIGCITYKGQKDAKIHVVKLAL